MGFFNNIGASFSLEEIEKYIKEKGWNKKYSEYDADTVNTIGNTGFSNFWFSTDFDDDNWWDTYDTGPDDDGWCQKKACWAVVNGKNSSCIEVRTKIDGGIYCEKASVSTCLGKLVNAMRDNKEIKVINKYKRCTNQRFADLSFGFMIDGEYIEVYNVNRKIKPKKISCNGYEIMSDQEKVYTKQQQKYARNYANRRRGW